MCFIYSETLQELFVEAQEIKQFYSSGSFCLHIYEWIHSSKQLTQLNMNMLALKTILEN